jgi:metal-responsive CopG/Arc/MetJ family transcriptional regulator
MKSSNVIRKGGRPRIGKEIADVFSIRLPKEIAKAVKAYADREALKSRGKAIRQLVELGLAAAEANRAAAPKRARKPKAD